MKAIIGFVLVFLMVVLGVAGCSIKSVPAGYTGVKVYLLGSSKGVDSEELSVGRYLLSWNEELYLFPTFMQNYCWTKGNDPQCGSSTNEEFIFQTSEGLSVSADIGISYQLDPKKVNEIFQKYRRGVAEITDTFLRNMVRDALVKHSSAKEIEDVYGKGKALLITEVEKTVRDEVKPIGIIIDKISWIGDVRLPPKVIEALNLKIEATQKAQQRQNEVATARAEADKKIEEARGQAESITVVAKAQAAANRIIAESISPALNAYKSIEKWDGNLPKITGTAVPFISMEQLDKK